jgi:hypothetical protein
MYLEPWHADIFEVLFASFMVVFRFEEKYWKGRAACKRSLLCSMGIIFEFISRFLIYS